MQVTEILHPEMKEDKDFLKLKLVFIGTKEEAVAHIKEKDGDIFDNKYDFKEWELIEKVGDEEPAGEENASC